MRSDRLRNELRLNEEESGAEGDSEHKGKGEEGWRTWGVIDLGKAMSHAAPAEQVKREKELPRKEVIQPHLPVRLPCYDFVPIAGSALDGSLSCELGHRLQAYPTFMT